MVITGFRAPSLRSGPGMTTSIELCPRRLYDRRPFWNFGSDIGGEILRGAADEVDPEIAEGLLDGGIVERDRKRTVKRLDHLVRRACRRDQSMPRGRIEILDAELVDGRDVRQDRAALERRDGQRSHLALPDV